MQAFCLRTGTRTSQGNRLMSDSYRVLKFGGSSVGAPERIARVIQLVQNERKLGRIAVVCSAMGDTTDWLLEAVSIAVEGRNDDAKAIAVKIEELAINNGTQAYEILRESTPTMGEMPDFRAIVLKQTEDLRKILYGISLIRERSLQTTDLVLSFGERISNTVLAAVANATGISAVFQDAREWTVTNNRFGDALVDWSATEALIRELPSQWGEAVPFNTGFLGRTEGGVTTTLGRNGSDYTASLLAAGLKAADVQLWTDVSGVMTADPGIVPEAYPLERLSYMEALELSWFGTRMFHPRTMIPLIEANIPMRIRNTMRPDDVGTTVSTRPLNGESRPTSVSSLENLALIDVELRRVARKQQIGERVLQAIHARSITTWMTVQSGHGQAIGVVVPDADTQEALEAIREELAPELERQEVDPIDVYRPVSLVSLVAEAMGATPMVSGRFFSALGLAGVNIRAIAQGATGRSISCVIDAADTRTAVRTVHSAFNFAHQKVSLLVLGRGTVGSHLLQQIQAQCRFLQDEHDLQLEVVGLASSQKLLFDEQGIELDGWNDRLESEGIKDASVVEMTEARLESFGRLPVPILVDCTGADDMEDLYRRAFAHGVHVVAANKKPLTIPWEEREALMQNARRTHREYHYETTVGASLPVIDTLKNLVRTGDSVHLIEGSFSGTLGYLTNELMSGKPLEAAVREAKDLGYTEPLPQDDLSGLDVARKALILARELDLPLELDDVVVEPMVPARFIDELDLDKFFAGLKSYEEEYAKEIAAIRDEGKILRYIARIDPNAEGAKLIVGPVAVDAEHPAASLRGSEAFVAFTTARYQDYPLVVRGSGAGGAVTAAGVLADILRTAQALRGR